MQDPQDHHVTVVTAAEEHDMRFGLDGKKAAFDFARVAIIGF